MFEHLLFNTVTGKKPVLSATLCLYCGLLKIASLNPECMGNQDNPSKNSIGNKKEQKSNE